MKRVMLLGKNLLLVMEIMFLDLAGQAASLKDSKQLLEP
jgi:hypothetical protein